MIPILLSGTAVKGFLAEALACIVTEERNGIFELELTYPVSGLMFSELNIDRIIKAKPNDTADCQLFRIYQVTKPLNGIITVSAEHISYALSNYPVSNIKMTGTNATQAINAVLTTAAGNLASKHGFVEWI
jgi:phage minor structural protein